MPTLWLIGIKHIYIYRILFLRHKTRLYYCFLYFAEWEQQKHS